jgi:hypothetical protein
MATQAATGVPAGVQQGDGGAIRMAYEHGLGHAQGLQQRGQSPPGFVVHVVGLVAADVPGPLPPGLAAHVGHGVGLAIAPARVQPARAACGGAKLGGPVPAALLPHGHAAQAFMQEDQGGTFRRPRNVSHFQANARDVDVFHGTRS